MAGRIADDRVKDSVRALNDPEARNFQLIHTHHEFMDGTLHVVSFENASGYAENYVYRKGSDLEVAKNVSQLVDLVARKVQRPSWLDRLQDIGAVSIAVLLTLTICYLVVAGKETPTFLASALTLILGFFFGRKSGAKSAVSAAGRD